MKVGIVLLDGFDILTAVQKLRKVFTEIIAKEVLNDKFKQESYNLNLTFNELLEGTWSIEWFSKNGDPENSKRFRLLWYYALEDKDANQKFNDGNLAHKFVAEYMCFYFNNEEKEENKDNNKEEVKVITKVTNVNS